MLQTPDGRPWLGLRLREQRLDRPHDGLSRARALRLHSRRRWPIGAASFRSVDGRDLRAQPRAQDRTDAAWRRRTWTDVATVFEIQRVAKHSSEAMSTDILGLAREFLPFGAASRSMINESSNSVLPPLRVGPRRFGSPGARLAAHACARAAVANRR